MRLYADIKWHLLRAAISLHKQIHTYKVFTNTKCLGNVIYCRKKSGESRLQYDRTHDRSHTKYVYTHMLLHSVVLHFPVQSSGFMVCLRT